MVDQTIGDVFPPTFTANISRMPSAPDSHIPIKATINPMAIETKMPPRKPTIA
jgi:hypothetical protein